MNTAPQTPSERRVLIVSDGRSPNDLRLAFAREGLVTIRSESFKEARQRLFAERFDILVTDVRLGAFNGLHLAIVAHFERPEMQVVLLSDVDDPVLRQEADRVGARYIVTPSAPQSVRRDSARPARNGAARARRVTRRRRRSGKREIVNHIH